MISSDEIVGIRSSRNKVSRSRAPDPAARGGIYRRHPGTDDGIPQSSLGAAWVGLRSGDIILRNDRQDNSSECVRQGPEIITDGFVYRRSKATVNLMINNLSISIRIIFVQRR